MVDFYTRAYYDVNMMSLEAEQDGRNLSKFDRYDYEIDGSDPENQVDITSERRARWSDAMKENDRKYKEYDDKQRAEQELLHRKEGETMEEWQKRFMKGLFENSKEEFKKAKEKMKENMKKAVDDATDELKERLKENNQKKKPRYYIWCWVKSIGTQRRRK